MSEKREIEYTNMKFCLNHVIQSMYPTGVTISNALRITFFDFYHKKEKEKKIVFILLEIRENKSKESFPFDIY